MNGFGTTNLLRRTLLTVGALVGACVLFVGGTSVVAVAVTDRIVHDEDGVAPMNAAAAVYVAPPVAAPPAAPAPAAKKKYNKGKKPSAAVVNPTPTANGV